MSGLVPKRVARRTAVLEPLAPLEFLVFIITGYISFLFVHKHLFLEARGIAIPVYVHVVSNDLNYLAQFA